MPPQTVYLDTANWYDLAESKVDGTPFEKALRDERIVPVLSFIHLLEFGQREKPHRDELINCIEKFRLEGKLRWIRSLPAIAKEELEKAFLEYLGIFGKRIKAFESHFVDTLETYIPELDKAEARAYSIHDTLELLCKNPRFESLRQFRSTNPVIDIARLRKGWIGSGAPRAIEAKTYVYNVLADMPKRLETPAGVVINVTQEHIRGFLANFQLDSCPTVSLRVSVMVGWSMTSGGAAPSDFEDLFHLAGTAYCDKAFADKRTCDALSKAKVLNAPGLNSTFSKWVESLVDESLT